MDIIAKAEAFLRLLYIHKGFKSKFINRFRQLHEDDIDEICLNTAFYFFDDYLYMKKSKKSISRMYYRIAINKIKNLLKINKRYVSLEQFAKDTGIDVNDLLDSIFKDYSYRHTEFELDFEMMMKSMPRDIYEVLLWRCLDYKIEDIAEGLRVSKRTVQRRLDEAKEYVKALLSDLPPPRKIIKIRI